MTDNQTLLAEYARNGSDVAFREIVTCYVDLVYSTALRLVEGDTHRAEDVTQTVFVDLARSARTLAGDFKLGGWLHRHTCFVTATLLRGEVGTLKQKFAEATKIQTQPTVLTEQLNLPHYVFYQHKLMSLIKAGDAHVYLAAFLDYSDTHNGQFPTNWDQIRENTQRLRTVGNKSI